MVFKKIRETIYRSLQNKNNIYLSFLASDPPASRATKSRKKGREDILTVFCPFSFLVGKTEGTNSVASPGPSRAFYTRRDFKDKVRRCSETLSSSIEVDLVSSGER